MMSSSGQRRYRVNRVNSSDCYYDGRESRGGRLKDSKRARSRSTDHLPNQVQQHTELNSMSIRKMLRPVHTAPESPVTSPENTRGHKHGGTGKKTGAGGAGNLLSLSKRCAFYCALLNCAFYTALFQLRFKLRFLSCAFGLQHFFCITPCNASVLILNSYYCAS